MASTESVLKDKIESLYVDNCNFDCVQYDDGDPNTNDATEAGTSDSLFTHPDAVPVCDESYRGACPTNLTADIDTAFSNINYGEVINRSDFESLENVLNDLITNRSLINIDTTLNTESVISSTYYTRLRDWLMNYYNDSSRSLQLNDMPVRRSGSLISAADWDIIKYNVKDLARACNIVDLNACPHVCYCDTVCTCECDSKY